MSAFEVPELAALMRAGAHGSYCAEAAVGVLIAHGSWLQRSEFVDAVITECVDDLDDCLMVVVEWDDVVDFLDETPCSSGEAAVLLIGASIAGARIMEPLGDLLICLDEYNLGFVLEAIAHAGGWHERQQSRLVTGEFGGAR